MISISKAGICGATRLLSGEHRNTYYPWNVYSSLLSVLWQHWQASPLSYIPWIANKSNKKRPHCMNFVRLPVHTTWAAFECKDRTKKRKKESERANERVYVCVRACKYCRILQLIETRSTRAFTLNVTKEKRCKLEYNVALDANRKEDSIHLYIHFRFLS